MKIRIELENKELRSYAGLYEEMGMVDASSAVDMLCKNTSIKSKNFNMSNSRDDENEKVIGEVEIKADFLIKIIRKMSPIIGAFKMVWGLIENLFEDITEDIGDIDDWEIEMEDDESESTDEEMNCGNHYEGDDSPINE